MSAANCVGWGAVLKSERMSAPPPTRNTLALLAYFDLPTKGEVKKQINYTT
jgi:hypothetical protein